MFLANNMIYQPFKARFKLALPVMSSICVPHTQRIVPSSGRCTTAVSSQRINCSYKVIIRGIKLPGNLQKKWGSSIKNSLVIATKILEVLNYKGEFLRDIISFPAKI